MSNPFALPSMEEALGLLKAVDARKVRIADFRVLRGQYEFADHAGESGSASGSSSGQAVGTFQNYEARGAAIVVLTEFKVTLPVQEAEDRSPPAPTDSHAAIEFATGISYSFDEEIKDSARVVIAKCNGVLHSWPYWRTFCLSSLAQMRVYSDAVAPFISVSDALLMSGFKSTAAEKHATEQGLHA